MQHKQLSKPQTVNACTLISIAVIQAILTASDDKEMEIAIKKAQTESQDRYTRDFTNTEDGAGILEEDAYTRYFAEQFAKPTRKELSTPTQNIDVEDLLKNRKNLSLIEFMTFNGEAIEAIEQAIKAKHPTVTIDWDTIKDEQLKELIPNENKPPLRDQFFAVISELNSQGITIRTEGHTISLAKKGNIYYSYDSVTGTLSYTNSTDDMANHIIDKLNKNRAKGAMVYTFSPTVTLNKQAEKQSNDEEKHRGYEQGKEQTHKKEGETQQGLQVKHSFQLESDVQDRIYDYNRKIKSITIPTNQGQTKREIEEQKNALLVQLDKLRTEIKEDPVFAKGLKENWGKLIPITDLENAVLRKKELVEQKAIEQLLKIEKAAPQKNEQPVEQRHQHDEQQSKAKEQQRQREEQQRKAKEELRKQEEQKKSTSLYVADKEKVAKINEQLAVLTAKITELKEGGYTEAAQAAQNIYNKVDGFVKQYEKGIISEQQLKNNSQTIINANRGELKEFRGWKLKKVGEVLVNLLALICSCGVSYFATGKFTLFTAQTDSAEKVSNLEASINSARKSG